MKSVFNSLVLTLLVLTPAARADVTIDLGFVSFDNVIPGAPGFPGVNGFSVYNFTGVFALPIDFPVLTSVTFVSASLDSTSLGDLAPGIYDPFTLGTAFPDTTLFTSATFTATLDQTTLLLADGTTFQANSPNISVTVLPSAPPDLEAGADFAVISVTGQILTPDPASVSLLVGVLFACVLIARRKRSPV